MGRKYIHRLSNQTRQNLLSLQSRYIFKNSHSFLSWSWSPYSELLYHRLVSLLLRNPAVCNRKLCRTFLLLRLVNLKLTLLEAIAHPSAEAVEALSLGLFPPNLLRKSYLTLPTSHHCHPRTLTIYHKKIQSLALPLTLHSIREWRAATFAWRPALCRLRC